MKTIKFPKLLKYTFGILAIAVLFVPAKIFAGGLTFAAMTNFSSVDLSDEEVRDLADVVMDEAFTQPKITDFHTVIPGIVSGKQIVYAGLLEKITKLDAGCGTGATSKAIAFRQKSWDPKSMKVWLQLCANEFEQTLMIYSQKKGLNRDDITGTDIAKFMVDHINPAMLEDMFRIAWFNDTDHSTVDASSGSMLLTSGISTTDYDMLDGFWNQIFAIVTANSARRVTIAENSAVSKVLQDTLGANTANDLFADLLTQADPRLRAAQSKLIICTQSLFDNYIDFLESKDNSVAYLRFEGGFTGVKRRNVTVIGWEFWDRTIRADFDQGTTWDRPHRALLTTPENLQIGLDDQAALNDLEIWYSQDTEKNNFRGKYRADAKIATDFMIQVGY